MRIDKTATDKRRFFNPISFHHNAREAFRLVLDQLTQEGDCELLLPAYIGYSSREGSGIYDPVLASGIRHSFYKVNKKLQINKASLCESLNRKGEKAVLIVHYFGIPDSCYGDILEICNKHCACIIEDAAHAFYTDFVDHNCGDRGDYIFYSIHKMLPFLKGGMLKQRCGEVPIESSDVDMRVFNYDFYGISCERKKNARLWNQYILDSELYPQDIELLFPFREDVTYQTFPVVIKNGRRDDLYFGLNKAGYGAVSLYHQMIQPIQDGNFEESIWLSEHILNLPVHQDIKNGDIEDMFRIMKKIMRSEE